MRFPRINRIRWDKPAAEADRIETLEKILAKGETELHPFKGAGVMKPGEDRPARDASSGRRRTQGQAARPPHCRDARARASPSSRAEVARFVAAERHRARPPHRFCRHTSASLPSRRTPTRTCRRDLLTALDRLAPAQRRYMHDIEGPDDMPAHIRAMLTGARCRSRCSTAGSRSAPGRASISSSTATSPHRREIVLHVVGGWRRQGAEALPISFECC